MTATDYPERLDAMTHKETHGGACTCHSCTPLKVDAEQAITALRNGKTVRMTVGTGADDPVLLLTVEDGSVISRAIDGWSAGVTEPVCTFGSAFLRTYLANRASLEVL